MTIALHTFSHATPTRWGTAHTRRPIGFLLRLPFQVLGATLIGVLFPTYLRGRIRLDWLDWTFTAQENAVLATLIAVVIGALILRRMTAYPGVWAVSYVLPVFSVIYMGLIAVFFFLRFEYSGFVIGWSFLLVVVWFAVILSLERRLHRLRLLLIPDGGAKSLAANAQAEWVMAPETTQLSLPFVGETVSANHRTNGVEVGSLSELPADIDGVVADLRADLPPDVERFLADCALKGLAVYHSKQIDEALTGRVEIEHLSENTFGSLIPSSAYFRFKRTMDLVVAVALIPVVALIAAVVAVAIRLDDNGPIFFSQERIGFGGRVFRMLKFRTMHFDGNEGEFFTEENDFRITRIGRWLRHYRIDEMPQIINVLRGEMSWIGPRPEAVPLSKWYESKIPFYSYRHIVRPGVTGWAQVNQGNVAKIAAATGKLHYDFFYIKNFSPWLDLLIAARTLRIIVTGFGSR
jgi:exopolysaccharide biosynthesis polyprenyl glycosylphosphotransferase